ncbi:hypothetical protein [Psychroflexus planctonicus]|uniref:Uncharacterized protein n=1 Tax=Psychroflexus planctonicus TaxID=1526575 RepID=A0ABQ1SEH8_9FLAO|nr:hypothetical protein [Psychroflexus planctonicus]GGE27305.1 hypothetical protein GCM10010832_05020 [Psychroflexus planctonicus]
MILESKMIKEYGAKLWKLKSGLLHREDGPAYVDNGIEKWYLYGALHREGGPAVVNKYEKKWYKLGKLHRENGPAIESNVYPSEWWLNDVYYTESEFRKEVGL